MDFDIPDIDTVDQVHAGVRPMPRASSATPAAVARPSLPVHTAHATATASFAASTVARPTAPAPRPVQPAIRPPAPLASGAAPQNARPIAAAVITTSSAQALKAFAGSAAPGLGATGGSVVDPRTTLLVGQKQRGNPILSYVKNVRWAFSDIVPDYVMGRSTCAIYLSLRFHSLHPTYLFKRIKDVRNDYKLRVVLVQVDIDDVEKSMLDVCRTAILSDFTVVCAFSPQEAARYLETYKAYENKSAASIQERVDGAYLPKVTEMLTSIRSVNKTDVLTLLSHFGSVARILTASQAELAECPGIGDKKVRRIFETLHAPLEAKSARPAVAPATATTTSATSTTVVSVASATAPASPPRGAAAMQVALSPPGAVTFPAGDAARDDDIDMLADPIGR